MTNLFKTNNLFNTKNISEDHIDVVERGINQTLHQCEIDLLINKKWFHSILTINRQSINIVYPSDSNNENCQILFFENIGNISLYPKDYSKEICSFYEKGILVIYLKNKDDNLYVKLKNLNEFNFVNNLIQNLISKFEESWLNKAKGLEDDYLTYTSINDETYKAKLSKLNSININDSKLKSEYWDSEKGSIPSNVNVMESFGIGCNQTILKNPNHNEIHYHNNNQNEININQLKQNKMTSVNLNQQSNSKVNLMNLEEILNAIESIKNSSLDENMKSVLINNLQMNNFNSIIDIKNTDQKSNKKNNFDKKSLSKGKENNKNIPNIPINVNNKSTPNKQTPNKSKHSKNISQFQISNQSSNLYSNSNNKPVKNEISNLTNLDKNAGEIKGTKLVHHKSNKSLSNFPSNLKKEESKNILIKKNVDESILSNISGISNDNDTKIKKKQCLNDENLYCTPKKSKISINTPSKNKVEILNSQRPNNINEYIQTQSNKNNFHCDLKANNIKENHLNQQKVSNDKTSYLSNTANIDGIQIDLNQYNSIPDNRTFDNNVFLQNFHKLNEQEKAYAKEILLSNTNFFNTEDIQNFNNTLSKNHTKSNQLEEKISRFDNYNAKFSNNNKVNLIEKESSIPSILQSNKIKLNVNNNSNNNINYITNEENDKLDAYKEMLKGHQNKNLSSNKFENFNKSDDNKNKILSNDLWQKNLTSNVINNSNIPQELISKFSTALNSKFKIDGKLYNKDNIFTDEDITISRDKINESNEKVKMKNINHNINPNNNINYKEIYSYRKDDEEYDNTIIDIVDNLKGVKINSNNDKSGRSSFDTKNLKNMLKRSKEQKEELRDKRQKNALSQINENENEDNSCLNNKDIREINSAKKIFFQNFINNQFNDNITSKCLLIPGVNSLKLSEETDSLKSGTLLFNSVNNNQEIIGNKNNVFNSINTMNTLKFKEENQVKIKETEIEKVNNTQQKVVITKEKVVEALSQRLDNYDDLIFDPYILKKYLKENFLVKEDLGLLYKSVKMEFSKNFLLCEMISILSKRFLTKSINKSLSIIFAEKKLNKKVFIKPNNKNSIEYCIVDVFNTFLGNNSVSKEFYMKILPEYLCKDFKIDFILDLRSKLSFHQLFGAMQYHNKIYFHDSLEIDFSVKVPFVIQDIKYISVVNSIKWYRNQALKELNELNINNDNYPDIKQNFKTTNCNNDNDKIHNNLIQSTHNMNLLSSLSNFNMKAKNKLLYKSYAIEKNNQDLTNDHTNSKNIEIKINSIQEKNEDNDLTIIQTNKSNDLNDNSENYQNDNFENVENVENVENTDNKDDIKESLNYLREMSVTNIHRLNFKNMELNDSIQVFLSKNKIFSDADEEIRISIFKFINYLLRGKNYEMALNICDHYNQRYSETLFLNPLIYLILSELYSELLSIEISIYFFEKSINVLNLIYGKDKNPLLINSYYTFSIILSKFNENKNFDSKIENYLKKAISLSIEVSNFNI